MPKRLVAKFKRAGYSAKRAEAMAYPGRKKPAKRSPKRKK